MVHKFFRLTVVEGVVSSIWAFERPRAFNNLPRNEMEDLCRMYV